MDHFLIFYSIQCISQNNSEEKHRMISQMDQIYANAFFTIIAAAGEDCHEGLPGVSSCHRPLRQEVTVRGTTFLELGRWPGNIELSESTWASRAWTYQEGFLSARRLVFLANQAFYLCNGMCVRESVQQRFQGAHQVSIGAFRHITPQHRDKSVHHFMRQVEEYSKRHLSYEEDSLNAFLGVLNFYTRSTAETRSPIMHLFWGLTVDKVEESDFRVHLQWYHTAPAARRTGFPSWTWAGWGGPVQFLRNPVRIAHKDASAPTSISVEHADHRVENIIDYATAARAEMRKGQIPSLRSYPTRLRIDGLVLPVRFRRFELSKVERSQHTLIRTAEAEFRSFKSERNIGPDELAILQICRGVYTTFIEAPLLDRKLEEGNHVLAVLLTTQDKSACTWLLICELPGDGVYERVGIVRASTPRTLHNWAPYWKVFLDAEDNLLDEVTLPAHDTWYVSVAERREFWLV